MAKGGGGGVVSKTEPWAAQKPYLKRLYGRAENLYGGEPFEYYPGQTYAPRDLATEAGEELALDRALGGSPLVDVSGEMLGRTVAGDYLDPSSNPWLGRTFEMGAQGVREQFNRTVMPNIESRFGAAGRSRSGAYQAAGTAAMDALGGSLSDLATKIYGGAYESERNRQMGAVPMAMNVSRDPYEGYQMASTIGAARRDYAQEAIDEAMGRWNFAQEEPWMRTERYGQLIGAPVMTTESRPQLGKGWATAQTIMSMI